MLNNSYFYVQMYIFTDFLS
uniref:Uncharacterized protein n=1 Tax=Anguilla anguilla TaxID=7936 RepID=A0A0E9SU97_ANGAN